LTVQILIVQIITGNQSAEHLYMPCRSAAVGNSRRQPVLLLAKPVLAIMLFASCWYCCCEN